MVNSACDIMYKAPAIIIIAPARASTTSAPVVTAFGIGIVSRTPKPNAANPNTTIAAAIAPILINKSGPAPGIAPRIASATENPSIGAINLVNKLAPLVTSPFLFNSPSLAAANPTKNIATETATAPNKTCTGKNPATSKASVNGIILLDIVSRALAPLIASGYFFDNAPNTKSIAPAASMNTNAPMAN